MSESIVYSDFEDELGDALEVTTTYITGGVNVAQYRKKVESFLKENLRDEVIVKIRTAKPITPQDLARLEELFFEAEALESRETFERAYGKQENLGLFVRQLTGMDRRSAEAAFASYLNGKAFSADQIEFVKFLVEHFARSGVVDPKLLYDRPYTDLEECGLDGMFTGEQADELIGIIGSLNRSMVVEA